MKRFASRLWHRAILPLAGACLVVLSPGADWEAGVGLDTLFAWRGPLAPPGQVAVVAIDDSSGDTFAIARKVREWSRSRYAQLVRRLHEAGARAIVIDVHFREPRDDEGDRLLADALRQAGNVVLFGYLQREFRPLPAVPPAGGDAGLLMLERFQPPIPQLADAAAAVAPFVLPKVPARVRRFWIRHPDQNLLSLPAAAQVVYSADAYARPPGGEPAHTMLATFADDTCRAARASLVNDRTSPVGPGEAGSPTPEQRLRALSASCELPDYTYLNFYGPPRTVLTLPFEKILAGDAATLAQVRGRAVFVGYSASFQPSQRDGFVSVFSSPNGLDLSGVEIAATAFANLVNRETIVPLPDLQRFLLVLAYGTGLLLLLRYLPGYRGVMAVLAMTGLYCLLVYSLFLENLWLPWVVPVLVCTPVALLAGLGWQYRQAQHGRQRLQTAFGYYLPGEVVERLARDSQQAMAQGETAFGVCLSSDAEQYTALAETLAPGELKRVMNRYYERLFAPVRERGGMVSDVVGDAMLAIWSAANDRPPLRARACEAALAIVDTPADDDQPALRTRIGLHAGELVLSHIGAIDHYEYRAVGDIVNTASRIENLNKQLGTSILVSAQVLSGLDGFVARDLGSFRLRGKRQSVRLYELAGTPTSVSDAVLALHARFAVALEVFNRHDYAAARNLFAEVLERYPDDGPSRYYFAACDDRGREGGVV